MELKLESGLPHQEYAVEAISEVFKQVEINQQVAHYSNPVIDLRSNRFIGNIYRIQQRERQNVAEKYRNEQPVGNTLCLDIKMETGTGKTYVYTHTIFELLWHKQVHHCRSKHCHQSRHKHFSERNVCQSTF